ncbi:MAG: hypothetical protein JWM65_3428 [Sphingomonas bacterium]|nr:hypothetical protein [Sphingomonas bacterium]
MPGPNPSQTRHGIARGIASASPAGCGIADRCRITNTPGNRRRHVAGSAVKTWNSPPARYRGAVYIAAQHGGRGGHAITGGRHRAGARHRQTRCDDRTPSSPRSGTMSRSDSTPSSGRVRRHGAYRPIRGPFRRRPRSPPRRPAPRRRSRHYGARRRPPRRRCRGPRRSLPTLPIRRWRCRTG